MSVNSYARLRALLPTYPLLLCTVLEVHADDTSTVQLPDGRSVDYGSGLAAGATLRVRGSSVAAGLKVFVRNGVIDSQAPDAPVADVVVGTIVDKPLGPDRLAAVPDFTLPAAASGVAYSASLEPAFTGGYAPRVYALVTGTLPAGLALDSSTGALSGTTTAAGSYGLTFTCQDSTFRFQALPPVTLTVA